MQNKGITLVALVITIIILLILAGITISLTIGQRGILNRAQEAGKNYQEVAKREDEQLSNFLKETDNMNNGIVENGEATNPLPENAIVKKVAIGDYVAYDPTAGITDEEKAAGKLRYTSSVGTGMSHGNGYETTNEGTDISTGQTFTAISSTKWRVLSKDETTGEVVLISDKPIQTDAGTGFYMRGAIGYLYAEQELNEICKIYGYGTGANTGKTFGYQTGDVVEGLEAGTITGSGARSINVEDINKITNYNPSNNTTGYEEEYTYTIFYPTKETASGAPKTATKRTDKYTEYWYKVSQYLTDTESTMYKMLIDNSNITYWLASRGIRSYSDYARFILREVDTEGEVDYASLYIGYSGSFDENSAAAGVRPIVYLKPNIQTSGKDESGAWVISE